MFFGLTNSLAMFQTMMNQILWNLINTRKVVSFMDNMIVEIEIEKGHDKIVEEVVKRLAENNLYVKLEKYKWKVRKVEFLRIVIEGNKDGRRENEIFLDWPTPKGVKDIQEFLGLAN